MCGSLDSNEEHKDLQSFALPIGARATLLFNFVEAEEFESPGPLRPLVFKTSAINHSATLPFIY